MSENTIIKELNSLLSKTKTVSNRVKIIALLADLRDNFLEGKFSFRVAISLGIKETLITRNTFNRYMSMGDIARIIYRINSKGRGIFINRIADLEEFCKKNRDIDIEQIQYSLDKAMAMYDYPTLQNLQDSITGAGENKHIRDLINQISKQSVHWSHCIKEEASSENGFIFDLNAQNAVKIFRDLKNLNSVKANPDPFQPILQFSLVSIYLLNISGVFTFKNTFDACINHNSIIYCSFKNNESGEEPTHLQYNQQKPCPLITNVWRNIFWLILNGIGDAADLEDDRKKIAALLELTDDQILNQYMWLTNTVRANSIDKQLFLLTRRFK